MIQSPMKYDKIVKNDIFTASSSPLPGKENSVFKRLGSRILLARVMTVKKTENGLFRVEMGPMLTAEMKRIRR